MAYSNEVEIKGTSITASKLFIEDSVILTGIFVIPPSMEYVKTKSLLMIVESENISVLITTGLLLSTNVTG